ncbi:MAG: hypothetical protein M3Z28_06435, partial [Candidatus Dormibacteraeota bacterium]|nr:hypothetical protein [Candidatus Dormibacteraeota bacterium]
RGDQVWIKQGDGAPRSVSLPPMRHLGVDFAGYNYQEAVKVSADGRYLVVVSTKFGRLQVFDTASGTLVWGAPAGSVYDIRTMAIWSRGGHRLYWRDNAGVHTWDPSQGAITLIPGLIWYEPSLSPDGHSIAYTVRDPQTFAPHVEVRDLDTGSVVPLPHSLRAGPLFTSPGAIWYRQEKPTPGPGGFSGTGVLFSYDLHTRQESELPLHAEFGLELYRG